MIYTRSITLIALFTALLFIQEQLLSFIPNVQLTFFLLILFSKKLKFIESILISFIYVMLDNLALGNSYFLFVPFMLLGILIIPISLNTIFKKVDSHIHLALLGILFSFIYSFILIIPGSILFEVDVITYLKGDIVYEIILAVNSFLTTLLLYKSCSKIFDKYNKKAL